MTKREEIPQRELVLQMLRDAGTRGVHTFEIRQAYIANPSQRIAELEAAGHRITHTRERLHGAATGTRYRLLPTRSGDTSNGTGEFERTPGPSLELFDSRVGKPAPRGAYDELDTAA